MKVCTKCKIEKALGEFYTKGKRLDSWCRGCNNKAAKERYENDTSFRRRKLENSKHYRRYGLTKQDFQYLLFNQKGACEICRQAFTKTPHIDHDHRTNKVRGLLCVNCNNLLGHAKENPVILERAKDYLFGLRSSSSSRAEFEVYFDNLL